MKCKVYYLYPDGSQVADLEFGIIDFDYFNIRQYRKLLTKFSKENEKFHYHVRLLFRPVEDLPFETFNKYQVRIIKKNKDEKK